MKIKILSLLFAMLLVCGLANAVDLQSGDNAVIVGSEMGPAGKTPMTEVIKVYDTSTGTGTSIGCAMVWDISAGNNDGYHVRRASLNADDPTGTEVFAGIMLSRSSKDNAQYGPIGYMAIRGLARANFNAAPTAGYGCALSGRTSEGTLTAKANITSNDVGVALGGAKIWLK